MPKLFYFISEAMRGLKGNKRLTFSSILVIAVCFALVGSSLILQDIMVNTIQREVQKNQYLAYVSDTLTDAEAYALQGALAEVPNVASVTFISNDQAKKEFADFLESDIVNELSSDIFRHRYAVSFIDSSKAYDTILDILDVKGITNVEGSLEIADGFTQMQTSVQLAMNAISVILVVISFIVICNSLSFSAQAREDENYIMRLCGVSESHIRFPVLFEGLIIGLTGAVFGFLLQGGAYYALYRVLADRGLIQMFEMPIWGVYALFFGQLHLVAGGALGLFAGLISGKTKKGKKRTLRKEPKRLAKRNG